MLFDGLGRRAEARRAAGQALAAAADHWNALVQAILRFIGSCAGTVEAAADANRIGAHGKT